MPHHPYHVLWGSDWRTRRHHRR
uniref:Uncharacterized protein n=1 Tax=Arundo donax TaxID=35708 RepID=A0A0A9BSJ6_ARUDO